jgi:peptidoglycan hydrolase-like protein with peptidoglycan-binding domain
MATYKQVSYGSQGSDVTELQKLLNQNGYNLSADGIYGSKTQAAVKDYQQKNNLAVDGIVGNNTWGALTKAQNNSNQATPSTPAPAETKAPTFEYGAYKPSDTVAQAEALLQQQMAQKPGQYQSAWQTQLNDVLGKILNREKFSYDLNGDALYQQYKDQYTTQGKMAMMDTMGQAAALTGGYGNSYAQSVGQQAYQGYLQQLNDKIPELYQLALNQYNAEGDDMYNQASLMAQMEDQDYGRYRDQLSDYNADLDRLYNQYNTERDYDYSKYADDRNFAYGQFSDDRNYSYQTERDKIADAQWQAEFDEAKRQYDQQYALSASKRYSGTPTDTPDTDPEPDPDPDPIEVKMDEYVKNMLNNVLEKGVSTQWNPVAAINANKALTKEEKAVAIEIVNEYIASGAMKSQGRIE